eukprot:2619518-Amphidinium_carterae.1
MTPLTGGLAPPRSTSKELKDSRLVCETMGSDGAPRDEPKPAALQCNCLLVRMNNYCHLMIDNDMNYVINNSFVTTH